MSKKILIVFVMLILFFVGGYFFINKKPLSVPDQILIHSNSNIIEISKDSSEFNEVFELTKGRFNFNVCVLKDVIDDSVVESMIKNGVGIEFKYNTEQKSYINLLKYNFFKYNKLYFELTDKDNNISESSVVNTFQYGDQYNYKDSSRGPLKYSKELVELVNRIIENK